MEKGFFCRFRSGSVLKISPCVAACTEVIKRVFELNPKRAGHRRSESLFTRKPDRCAAIFDGDVPQSAIPILLRVAGQFRRETHGRRAVLDPELWINSFEMFSDSRRRNSED